MEGYCRAIEKHVLPYFDDGERVVNSVTQQEYDLFMVSLTTKKVDMPKYKNMSEQHIPCLSTGTISKVKIALGLLLSYGHDWKYNKLVPNLKAPPVRYKKTAFWTEELLNEAYLRINDDLLHLVFHLCLVGSMRAGEVQGIEIHNIDFENKKLHIEHAVERVEDEMLRLTNFEGVKLVFPKKIEDSDSSLVLKIVKTEESDRMIPLTDPLQEEIMKRLEQIKEDKVYYGPHYQDYGLLICYPDGTPIEVNRMNKLFKKWQQENKFAKSITMQGLRKSAQMFKNRMEGSNRQKVAEGGGHSVKVMDKHYDEVIDADLADAARKLDINYYSKLGIHKPIPADAVAGTPDSYKALLSYMEPSEENELYNNDGVSVQIVEDLVKMVVANPNSLENALVMYNSLKASNATQASAVE